MATLRYLCIVGDIEAQADQAGLELLRAQSARVVLGELCGRGGRGRARRRRDGPQAMQRRIQQVSVTDGERGTERRRRRRSEEVLVGGEEGGRGAPCTEGDRWWWWEGRGHA